MASREVVTETKRLVTVCDSCGGSGTRQCFGCGGDFCYSHRETMQVHVFTAERLGDYPYYLCPPCLEALTPYRGRAEVIVEECRMELDTLERQWRANLGKKEG